LTATEVGVGFKSWRFLGGGDDRGYRRLKCAGSLRCDSCDSLGRNGLSPDGLAATPVDTSQAHTAQFLGGGDDGEDTPHAHAAVGTVMGR